MRSFEKDTTNQLLLISLNYMLEVGIDVVLERFSNATEDDLKEYPHVVDALKERGLLK